MKPSDVAWSINHEWTPARESLEAFVARRFPQLRRDVLAEALELVAGNLVERQAV